MPDEARPWENLPRCPEVNCPWPVYPGKIRCDAHQSGRVYSRCPHGPVIHREPICGDGDDGHECVLVPDHDWPTHGCLCGAIWPKEAAHV